MLFMILDVVVPRNHGQKAGQVRKRKTTQHAAGVVKTHADLPFHDVENLVQQSGGHGLRYLQEVTRVHLVSNAASRRPPREHASASGTSAVVLPLAAPAASAIATNER